MNVVSKEECDRVGSPIGDGTFCAGTTDGRDSCRGDSGGPLVARRFDGSYTVIGIVSYSKVSCCCWQEFAVWIPK